MAIRLLESGEAASRLVRRQPPLQPILRRAGAKRAWFEKILGTDLVTTCAQCRFNAARGLVREVTKTPGVIPTSLTEKIDNVLMNRLYAGSFLIIMLAGIMLRPFHLGAARTPSSWNFHPTVCPYCAQWGYVPGWK